MTNLGKPPAIDATPGPQKRRPQSASRVRPSSASTVQQKLQVALQSAERTAADLTLVQPQFHESFKARGVATAASLERVQSDRSISRYRNDAAIVSFAECPATLTPPFYYANNFMPGVHFFTFLAARERPHTNAGPNAPSQPKRTAQNGDASFPQRFAANNDEAPRGRKTKHAGALRMWIPDTIVYGETGRAVWLYSDEDGYVQRRTEFSEKHVVETLAPTADPEQVVVCKEPITKLATIKKTPSTTSPTKATDATAMTYEGNLLRLLSPSELKTVLSNVSSTHSTKSFALQRYVRCNGSKAFLVRGIYEYNKPAYAWMINNTVPMQTPGPTVSQVLQSLGQDASSPLAKMEASLHGRTSFIAASTSRQSVVAVPPPETQASDTVDLQKSDATPVVPMANRLCTSVQVDKSCNFIKLSERGCTTVAELNLRIVRYLEHRMHIQLQSLVADFVKDLEGKWWLLQVKHFRVRAPGPSYTKPFFSLPRRLRVQYLGYRDSNLVEESTDSDDETEQERRLAHLAAQLAQRQVRKLSQCKCCLAAYPKDELAFKMTLKMINEMLVRIRSRLPPVKSYTFLTAALARESSSDPSLAYESWSVCSYCYAIYEREQQLQKVEARFAEILGAPDLRVAAAGLGKLAESAYTIDPTATTTVLPAQLTLCRLMLVINGIYDIPPELYDAEKTSLDAGVPTRSTAHWRTSPLAGQSRLYLRISALGYTECIPIDPSDIIITQEQAPRGVRHRKASTASSITANEDDDDDEDDGAPTSSRTKRNYWLPINLIRTIHFFAPRTPLHAKLKETSGLTPFLNEDNSISIQFIRATEPPLHDLATPVPTAGVERAQVRRAALKPHRNDTAKPPRAPDAASVAGSKLGIDNHSVLLGATKLRMAQFRSAYVTKLDFYACMALRGEMFNIKGNIGLERVRYVDTKLLTSQHRLRAYNGVFIPDASYMPGDPLTSEWMDCLRATINPHAGRQKMESDDEDDADASLHKRTSLIRSSASTTSLGAGNEEMDEELEHMIDRRESHHEHQKSKSPQPSERASAIQSTDSRTPKPCIAPSATSTSRVDSQMAMLMQKPLRSPRNPPLSPPASTSHSLSHRALELSTTRHVWSLVIQLNQIHNMYTRERLYCRWECYYELCGQRRSAVERLPSSASPSRPAATEGPVRSEILFHCTHRFFLVATASMLAAHFGANRHVQLNLRNDVYESTRSRSAGEFFCTLDMARLLESRRFDTTLDIRPMPTATELTPREAAAVSRSPPFLSASIQLTQLALDPDEAEASGDYVLVGSTSEDVHVLKKMT